jgi:hypothetical protein
MSQIRRHRLFVDAKLQGALLTHVTLYWLYCLLSVGVIAIVWIVFAKRPPTSAKLFEEVWMNCGPALLGSILLLPLVLIDCLRLSNRFAGPMVRLQRTMKELADGQSPRHVKLREADFWTGFADDVNRLIDQYETAGGRCSTPQSEKPTETPAEPVAVRKDSAPVIASNIYADTNA